MIDTYDISRAMPIGLGVTSLNYVSTCEGHVEGEVAKFHVNFMSVVYLESEIIKNIEHCTIPKRKHTSEL